MSPHTAWLILQGIETLPLRMQRHGEQRAEDRGVPRGPGHRRARELPRTGLRIAITRWRENCCPGSGAVFSFDLKGGREPGRRFIESLRLFSHLANVGDARSLVIHPASTTHFRMDDAALVASGIRAGTIRTSIGLEDPDDLIADLKTALKVASK